MYAPTCLILLSLFSPCLRAASAREAFDSYTVQTVMAPMRDGVKLATDVYLPAIGGKPSAAKFPVLIERTCYNKTGRRKTGELLAKRGYAALIQDSRGRYASEGQFSPFEEGKDGYDAIEWAAAQSWSDGKVGSFGGSYTGMDQYTAALYRPPHLIGMFIQMAGASLYDSVSYPGGTPNAAWSVWILRSAASSPQGAQKKAAADAIENTVRTNLAAWLKQSPAAREDLLREFPDYQEFLRQSYAHSSFDSFWKERRFDTAGYYRELKDVPTMFVTGWYDNFMQGTLDVFSEVAKNQKTEKKLMVGPWPHGIGTPECGSASFGPDTTEDQPALIAEWFDHVLRQIPLETISDQKVQIYRMGAWDGSRSPRGKMKLAGEWRATSSWPPPGVHPTRYYIQDGGTLTPAAPSGGEPSRFEFDPRNPVPTIGGRYSVAGVPGCIQDQGLNRRADVLSYSSAPLEAALEVTGRIRAALWVSSDAPDTDFTAKVIDVYPNGAALNIADGEIRARYRKSFEKAEMMKVGEVYEVTIDLGSTSNVFAAGHRIRVDISSSSFPKFEPNSNTGEPAGSWTHQAVAHNAVYHEAKRMSYVELPVVRSAP